jgi:hypothetical protein
MVTKPKLTLDRINDILIMIEGNSYLMSDDEIYNYIRQVTIGIPYQTLNFSHGYLYRSRPNEGEKLFDNTKELWFPPLNCVRCNRFNDDKTQVLYVAELKSTVIEEVRPKPGTILTLITYSPTAQLNVLPVGILSAVTKTHLFDSKYWQNYISNKLKIYNNNFNYLRIDEIVNNYLNKHITKENKSEDPREYRLTNIYGKHFLTGPIDGLLYPSVSRKLFDINLVLKKQSAKKLKIVQVDVIKMDDKIPGKFLVITGSNEFKKNGDIIYNNHVGNFNEMTKI